MKSKKTWTKPQLTQHGTIEQLTEIHYSDVQQISDIVTSGTVFGLFASLDGM